MVYFKRNENAEDGHFAIPNDFPFDGIVIVGDFERGGKMKTGNAVTAIAVIFAICAALAASVLIKRRSA